MNKHHEIVLKISKEEGDFNYWIEKAKINPSNCNHGAVLRVFLKERGFKRVPKGTKEVLEFIKIYCLMGDGGYK